MAKKKKSRKKTTPSKKKSPPKTKKKVISKKKTSEPGKNKKPLTKPIVPGSTLNIKQQLWCRNYLTDFNATRAYKEVYGVSQKLAQSTAYRMLENAGVQTYLADLSKTLLDAAELSPAQVLRECRRIAMSDPNDMFDENECVLPIKDIPVALRRCISSFKAEELFVIDPETGIRIVTGRIIDVKLWSKDKNLDYLFKHLGLFAKDNAQKVLTLVDIAAKLNIDTEE